MNALESSRRVIIRLAGSVAATGLLGTVPGMFRYRGRTLRKLHTTTHPNNIPVRRSVNDRLHLRRQHIRPKTRPPLPLFGFLRRDTPLCFLWWGVFTFSAELDNPVPAP